MARLYAALVVTFGSVFGVSCSTQVGPTKGAVAGTVEATFVEYAPHIFVDSRLAPPEMHGPIWADVRLDSPSLDERRVARAILGNSLNVSEGDRVNVVLSDRANAIAQLAVPHEVTGRIDDTLPNTNAKTNATVRAVATK